MRTLEVEKVDKVLFFSVLTLLAVSVLMVFSATAISAQQIHGTSTFYLKRHLLAIFLGLVALTVAYKTPLHILRACSLPLLGIAVVVLLVVLVPGLGQVAGGARRWLQIGSLRVQPGEFAKVAVVLFMATYIYRNRERMSEFGVGTLYPLMIVGLCGVLLLAEPDFGSTVIIALVVFAQLLTSSRFLYLVGLGLLGIGAGAALIATSPYRMKRLQAFMDPFLDPKDSGYQLIQSLIAVGSGGVTGVGLGGSKQKLYYLPASHTDFIYAVLSEEFGLLGSIFILLLFLMVAYRGLSVAFRLADDTYLSSLAIGCTLLIVVPALLNMGVVLGLLPTKGLVLPLIAYGGTAMIMNLFVVGVLLRLSRIAEDD